MLKKYIVGFALLLINLVAFAQEFPAKPDRLVNDYADVLTPEQEAALSNKVEAFSDSTSTAIAIVTMRSVGEYDIGEYALQLGRKWGVGQSGKNNGIMILAAINDRKLTIQTGYGVEGALPDAITRQIREYYMNPRFRESDYYGGFDAAVDQIIKYTKGEYKAPAKKPQKDKGGPPAIVIIIIIIIIILAIVRRGGGGGGGQIIGRQGGASPLWWFLAGNMLGGGGRSSGGDWGGFSGGGGSWGGSGGFGGGSFGGGGSSGSW